VAFTSERTFVNCPGSFHLQNESLVKEHYVLVRPHWVLVMAPCEQKSEPFGELGAITGTQCWLPGIKDGMWR
jgi:hypothetical protein